MGQQSNISELSPEFSPVAQKSVSPTEGIFLGTGEMSALMRSFNWAATPLGPPDTWSPTLQAITRLVLSNSFPMLLWWGPDFLQIYNDAYIPVLGDKHPHAALAKPFRECWSEVFHILGPLAQRPYEGGSPTLMDDIPLEINRFGFVEETHFTIGYSAVPDQAAPRGIGGVLATVHETTEKVLADRRVLALRDLSNRSFEAKTAAEACKVAAETLTHYQMDIPFALIYLVNDKGGVAELAGAAEVAGFSGLCPEVVSLSARSEKSWPFVSCRDENAMVVIPNLENRFGAIPAGPWSDPPHTGVVIPINSNIAGQPVGFLVAGISSRLRLNDSYRGFLELVSTQIASGIMNARAYEDERKRNEALAELDRAKTTFFSNVSHEFRTPMTLMMAPIEDALRSPDSQLVIQRENLELAYRNGLRLLKLVNTLLDFSRIEAGRMQAVYEPIDLASLTAELASGFRSAVEAAGLVYEVHCAPVDAPVYVDRQMWEEIVLNLLSNAFKFTLNGSIEIRLYRSAEVVKLVVQDTGTGIGPDDLSHIFERFYRVKNAQGRSYEGSGIGLALVQELVRLHGGNIGVESAVAIGTTFTVSIPLGTAHLPKERIEVSRDASYTTARRDAYLEEALRWTPTTPATALRKAPGMKPRIILADDNADMRDYVQRLLSDANEIVPVSDGEAALQAALADPPDLVITDVMMPRLDGIGLIKEMRADSRTASIPVIVLSARAGDEFRVEGVSAGADDYLVKPFSARELIARVENHLALARLRNQTERRIRESEERFRALVTATSYTIYRMSPDWAEMRQLKGTGFLTDTEAPNRDWLQEYILPEDQVMVTEAIEDAIRRKSMFELEHRVRRADGGVGWTLSRAIPLLDEKGEIQEWFGTASNVTDRKQNEDIQSRLAAIVDSADDAIISKDLNGIIRSWNQGATRMFGYESEEMVGRSILLLIPKDLQHEEADILRKLRSGERIDHYETVRTRKDGSTIEVSITISPICDATGKVTGASKIARDISDRKRVERLLIQNEKLGATGRMAASVAHEINNPLESLMNLIYLARKHSAPDGRAHRYLLTAEGELERVSHIARQTLGFYRDTSSPTEVFLHDLIENILTVYNSKLLSAGISVDVRFNDLHRILASKGELLQVFSNVVANAIDSMPQGGTLHIATRKVISSKGDGMETLIRDTGTGIRPENLTKIFEPFFTTKGDRGTGIGLWVARQLVEARGGQVSAASSVKEGQSGTSVTIFLPLAMPHSSP